MGIYEQEQAYLAAEHYCEVSDFLRSEPMAPAPEHSVSVAAHHELQEKVSALSAELPGVTFGYIGNFERGRDDRSFYIFLPHPGRVGTYEDSVSLGVFDKLPAALAKWPQLEALARTKYATGNRR